MQNQTLTWIHLSDLHMEQQNTFNRRVVLDALWRDIEGFMEKGIQPDFIAFTGDVSYNGLTQEYKFAIEEFFDPLLSVTKVSKERLFIVPGNHDINRNKTDMIKSPIETIKKEDDIHKLLNNEEERELLLTPLSNYKNFVQSYLSSYQRLADPAFAYSQKIEKGEFIISIVGFNTAWLSGFHREADGKVNDFGKLALGELQARSVLSTDAHLRIALMHHPFDWLLRVDRTVVENIVLKNCSIVLRGHLHRPDILATANLSGELIVIPTGSVFDNRESPNAYNVVQIDLNTGTGTAYLRRYNNRRNEWQKDIESTGDEADGQTTFKIPKFWWAATIKAGKPEESANLKNYTCKFTDKCKQDMSSLNLTEDDVLTLVQGEFRSHLNYFRFDLEDYPLPVRTNYIVYLDKVQQRIEFKRIIPCTKNEAKLSSWNDILTVYRRATRMAYRLDPTKLLFVKGMVGRVADLHLDIEVRIEKHYKQFENLTVHPGLRKLKKTDEIQNKEAKNDVPASVEDIARIGDEIAFHILESHSACTEVYNIVNSMDAGDINENDAMSMMVIELERSLQHIHKIILRYPPIDR